MAYNVNNTFEKISGRVRLLPDPKPQLRRVMLRVADAMPDVDPEESSKTPKGDKAKKPPKANGSDTANKVKECLRRWVQANPRANATEKNSASEQCQKNPDVQPKPIKKQEASKLKIRISLGVPLTLIARPLGMDGVDMSKPEYQIFKDGIWKSVFGLTLGAHLRFGDPSGWSFLGGLKFLYVIGEDIREGDNIRQVSGVFSWMLQAGAQRHLYANKDIKLDLTLLGQLGSVHSVFGNAAVGVPTPFSAATADSKRLDYFNAGVELGLILFIGQNFFVEANTGLIFGSKGLKDPTGDSQNVKFFNIGIALPSGWGEFRAALGLGYQF